MLFNSLEFFIFLILFLGVWHKGCQTQRARLWWLTLASCFFYGWWDYRYLGLIFLSGMIDYVAGRQIHRSPGSKKLYLCLSLGLNLGVLGLFKYAEFMSRTMLDFLGLIHVSASWEHPHFLLPVGISFYTFQSMSYTIDIYRGRLQPATSILHFFAYLSMFPQLVAGPIVRARDILEDLKKKNDISYQDSWEGLKKIAQGFAKKVLIADNLAPFIDSSFHTVSYQTSGLFWWAVMVMFSFQIYCDFSGYSDIAIGLGRWMGIRFPENFKHPYIACGMKDFWSRWHISLSSWFRDYVYIPLGGAQVGFTRSQINMTMTMLLSGLWHGASMNFLVWGGLHAGFLFLERGTLWPQRLSLLFQSSLPSRFLTFILVTLAWVFFRADTFSDATQIISYMLGASFDELYSLLAVPYFARLALILILVRQVLILITQNWGRAAQLVSRLSPFEPLGYSVLMTVSFYFRGPGQKFIYFQF